jgi:hypothetical protein
MVVTRWYTTMLHILRFFKCRLFHNATFLVPALFAFYIQGVLKLKTNSGAKGLIMSEM